MTNYDKIIREYDSIFGWAKIFDPHKPVIPQIPPIGNKVSHQARYIRNKFYYIYLSWTIQCVV